MSLEMLFRIYYSDHSAEHIQVSEDPDGLDMVELRWCDLKEGYKSSDARINLTDDQVPELIEALTRLQEFRKTKR